MERQHSADHSVKSRRPVRRIVRLPTTKRGDGPVENPAGLPGGYLGFSLVQDAAGRTRPRAGSRTCSFLVLLSPVIRVVQPVSVPEVAFVCSGTGERIRFVVVGGWRCE